MAAKSRTPLERERDLRETAALYLRGLSQVEIAQRLKVSRQQIGYDLKVLQRRWQESALADFNAKKAAELAKMDELERTYWEAWERSCQAREVTTQEKMQASGSQTDDARLKAGVRKEQRDGNPEFLRGVERCIEMRCKITGAFAAVKLAPTTPDGKEEWHANDQETNAVLRAAFARLGLPVGGAGDAGTADDIGQALGLSRADPTAGGDNSGPVAVRSPADPESANPTPLFPPGG
jgi:transposase